MFHLLDSDTCLRECGTVLSVNKLVPIMNIAEILLSNNISLSKFKSILLRTDARIMILTIIFWFKVDYCFNMSYGGLVY